MGRARSRFTEYLLLERENIFCFLSEYLLLERGGGEGEEGRREVSPSSSANKKLTRCLFEEHTVSWTSKAPLPYAGTAYIWFYFKYLRSGLSSLISLVFLILDRLLLETAGP